MPRDKGGGGMPAGFHPANLLRGQSAGGDGFHDGGGGAAEGRHLLRVAPSIGVHVAALRAGVGEAGVGGGRRPQQGFDRGAGCGGPPAVQQQPGRGARLLDQRHRHRVRPARQPRNHLAPRSVHAVRRDSHAVRGRGVADRLLGGDGDGGHIAHPANR